MNNHRLLLPSVQDMKNALTTMLDATGSTIEKWAPKHYITGSTVRAWFRDHDPRRSMSYVRQCELIRALESEGVRFQIEGGFIYENGGQTAKSDPLRTTPLVNGHNSADRNMTMDRITMPS